MAKKGEILENVFVEKLIFGGVGLAHDEEGKAILISGGVIPESRVDVRILKNRKNHFEGQILEVREKSPFEVELPSHFQVYGGCKWLPIPYEKQLEIKQSQISEALSGLKEFLAKTIFHPIVPSPEIYGYRNKLEFSWGKYISHKEDKFVEFAFGFHKQWEFDRIIDCHFCALADESVNTLFKEMDTFSRSSNLPTYDPKMHQGFWRHFVVRKSAFTGEMMCVVSTNTRFEGWDDEKKQELTDFFTQVIKKQPKLVSVYLLHNHGKADIVHGDFELLLGKKSIEEILLGKTFEIQPQSFFQTNSLWAEKLYGEVLRFASKGELALDLYAGTGTIGIFLASAFKKVLSVELVPTASADGEKNAVKNGIDNMEFICDKAEHFLEEKGKDMVVDLVVVDPPRSGLHPSAVPDIRTIGAAQVIYVSCNPATLARDLYGLISDGMYIIEDVVPVDMFPHTHHIETVVNLKKAPL